MVHLGCPSRLVGPCPRPINVEEPGYWLAPTPNCSWHCVQVNPLRVMLQILPYASAVLLTFLVTLSAFPAITMQVTLDYTLLLDKVLRWTVLGGLNCWTWYTMGEQILCACGLLSPFQHWRLCRQVAAPLMLIWAHGLAMLFTSNPFRFLAGLVQWPKPGKLGSYITLGLALARYALRKSWSWEISTTVSQICVHPTVPDMQRSSGWSWTDWCVHGIRHCLHHHHGTIQVNLHLPLFIKAPLCH